MPPSVNRLNKHQPDPAHRVWTIAANMPVAVEYPTGNGHEDGRSRSRQKDSLCFTHVYLGAVTA